MDLNQPSKLCLEEFYVTHGIMPLLVAIAKKASRSVAFKVARMRESVIYYGGSGLEPIIIVIVRAFIIMY